MNQRDRVIAWAKNYRRNRKAIDASYRRMYSAAQARYMQRQKRFAGNTYIRKCYGVRVHQAVLIPEIVDLFRQVYLSKRRVQWQAER